MIVLSPKDHFLSDARAADAHGELCLNPAFQRACLAAWAEFTWRQQTSDATTGLRIDGGREFLKTLLNLGDKSLPIREATSQQLKPI